ncbi:unnamed protein product [Boreogadus saida]
MLSGRFGVDYVWMTRPVQIWQPVQIWHDRAVNLEDDITLPTRILRPDQESGGLMEKPYIWKANPEDNQDSTIKDSSRAGRGAVNLEDDITLPTRILRPDQESGGLMEKPYIWKANPEDNQDYHQG